MWFLGTLMGTWDKELPSTALPRGEARMQISRTTQPALLVPLGISKRVTLKCWWFCNRKPCGNITLG